MTLCTRVLSTCFFFSYPQWSRTVWAALAICTLVSFTVFVFYSNVSSPYSWPPDRDLTGVFEEFWRVCSSDFDRVPGSPDLKWIYFITPTYSRPQQVPELIRLSHTLMLVPNVHWIVAEDSLTCSPHVADILKRSGLPYTHLVSPMPSYFEKFVFKPKGVAGRRASLAWLKLHLSQADPESRPARDGVLYFGDDDNTFDLRLFSEIRRTQTVSMFPVGLIGDFGFSSPVVDSGKVVGFVDSWPDTRRFMVDMAGFAIATDVFLARPRASMPYLPGHEEDRFLRSLDVKLEDILPLADNCTQVLVWHTKSLNKPVGYVKHNALWSAWETNLAALYDSVRFLGLAQVDV